MDRTIEIRKVLLITLALNLLVSSAKIFYGYITGAISIFSDGFHSFFDGLSNIVGLVGIYIASKPVDKKHPYGHRKYETVFTIFIGLLMLLTCFEVFKRVYESLMGRHEVMVTKMSFIIMVITMIINFFVFTYEKRKGLKLNSEFLIADSKHTMSDIYVSIGVIVGLVFIEFGYLIADSILGAIIGIFIAKTGLEIIKDATDILVDKTQLDASIIKDIALNIENVMDCHDIRTRGTKGHIFLDLHITVNPDISVKDAHDIAELVEAEIKKRISDVVDVVVHIEPE